jgi:Kef-type K+ transport system membrane component KefB
MSSLTNYIDTSTKSLAIAGVVFLVVVVVAKYLLDNYSYSVETKEEDKRSTYATIMYCVLIGLVLALLSLVLCKQFNKFGTCDILTEPFPIKS